jgi:predicted GNAT family acetyltransferase
MSVHDNTVAARLHQFFRDDQARRGEVIAVPPFTAYLHPTNDAPDGNVALPNGETTESDQNSLEALRAIFARRGRRLRVQYVEEVAPDLASALAGFVESEREPLMICTRDTLRPPPAVPGLAIAVQTAATPLDEIRTGWVTNELGFDPTATPDPGDEVIERFRRELVEGRAFLARHDGEPAAAGMFKAPSGGVTELMGIATLAAFRGRGIAVALTARMAEEAFALGCDLVFLRPDDDRAARVYARVGFEPCGTLVTFDEAE